MNHDGWVDSALTDLQTTLVEIVGSKSAAPTFEAIELAAGPRGDTQLEVRHFAEPGYELWGIGVAKSVKLPAPWVDHAGLVSKALSQIEYQMLHGDQLTPVAFGALPFDRTVPAEVVIPQLVVRINRIETGDAVAASLIRIETDRPSEDSLLPSNDAAPHEPLRGGEIVIDQYDSITTHSISQTTWCERIDAATARLRNGDLDKVVLARAIDVELPQPVSTYALWKHLHAAFPHAMVFSIDGFVGASPELLVGRHATTVTAQPMAGTTKRTGNADLDGAAANELLMSEKNRHEHQITIDMVHDVLLGHCSYLDAQPAPTVVAAGPVQHLATLVSGQLSEPPSTALELASELHPTPAVGGFPHDDAIALMDELETNERGRYAGAVGWVDADGNGRFAVGIRSIELTDTHAGATNRSGGSRVGSSTGRLFVGVGVVADSDPEAEYEETVQKSRAILDALVAVSTKSGVDQTADYPTD